MSKRKGRSARAKAREAAAMTVMLEEKAKSVEHRVTLVADHNLDFPELYMSIYVAGTPSEERQFAELFTRAYCHKAKTLEDADLVVFAGGADVDPALYGAIRHPFTQFNPQRDNDDMALYMQCYDAGIPMLGICRGAQFLHVMNGGKLYQHVDGHQGDHPMFANQDSLLIEKVSSVHHQMVIHQEGMTILGTASGAKQRWLDPKTKVEGTRHDIEAFFYRETCCLGVQGHPEYRGYNFFAKWVLKQIENFVLHNPDVNWYGCRRRLTSKAGTAAIETSKKEKK